MHTAAPHTTTDDLPPLPVWVAWLPAVVRRPFEHSAALRKIGSNASWLMMERVVDLMIRFFVGAWMIRYLGPEQYGIYNYALSFIALFAVFATLGLDNIVVRTLAQGRHDPGILLTTTLALRITAAFLTFGLVILLALSVEATPLRRLAVLLVAGQLIFQSANVADLWFQAQVRSKYVVWARGSVTLLFAGGQVVCILAEFPLIAFLALVLAQSALTALGLFICFRRAGPKPMTWRVNKNVARTMLRDAWPLLFAGLSISIYMRIDQVMLGALVSNTAVGLYGAAVKLSELWYFIPGALVISLFPNMVRLRAEAKPAQYQQRMQTLYDVLAGFSYGIILALTLLAVPLIDVLFGHAFAASAPILQVHIWALLFVSLGVASSKWMITENRTVYLMVTTLLGALVNVGLNVALIPRFEGLGAAWATLLAYAVAAYLSLLLFKPLRPLFFQLSKALAAPLRHAALKFHAPS